MQWRIVNLYMSIKYFKTILSEQFVPYKRYSNHTLKCKFKDNLVNYIFFKI